MSSSTGIPPAVTEETAAFWEAAAQGRLVVERCMKCGAESFPPRGMCRACRNRAMDEVQITERGRIYSYTVNYQKWLPDLEVPYAIVLVEFPDHPGVRVAGRLRGVAPQDLGPGAISIGDEVEVGFEEGPAGYAIPSFATVAARGGEEGAGGAG